ncbi:hypothetical protein L596_004527 [Steinernema carpocapsae]|uniref:Uncharacterized protein n=1 Tax=Steinernema carpocapsae TaxID=34508 RepID=A0A4U8UXL3_STECR|nr:hypothetical protein L596_004527 [Steinernema carpocapsae]
MGIYALFAWRMRKNLTAGLHILTGISTQASTCSFSAHLRESSMCSTNQNDLQIDCLCVRFGAAQQKYIQVVVLIVW